MRDARERLRDALEAIERIERYAARGRTPEIPWSKIVGMRHILVHDYFEIDADAVWQAVERDIPELKRQMQALVRALDEQT